MALTVKLFAKARDLVGSGEIQLPWTDGQDVARLKQQIAESYPAVVPLMPRMLVAVNSSYANDAMTISTGDEVACFPPVSGG